MGLSNPVHIAFVLVLLLLVFGAKRLPELGRSLGTGMRGFKDSISGEEDPIGHTEETVATPPASLASVSAPASSTALTEPAVEPSVVRPVA